MEDMKFQFSIGRAEESRKQHFFSNSQKSQLLGIQDFVGLGRGLLLLLLLKVDESDDSYTLWKSLG